MRYDNYLYKQDFEADYGDKKFIIDILDLDHTSELRMNNKTILVFDFSNSSWILPEKVILPEEEAEHFIEINAEKLKLTYYFSTKGSLSSPPGGVYQEKLNSIFLIQNAVDSGKSYIMKDAAKIAYGNLLLAIAPIKNKKGESIGAVLLEISDRKVRDYKNSLYFLFISIGLIFAILSIFISYFLARYLTRPIIALSKAVGEIADGDMSARVDVNRKDEFGQLANSFNFMAKSVESAHKDLTNTNQAYSRFVPMKFLSLLGKESILDVKLTDQIQKEMSIFRYTLIYLSFRKNDS